MRDVKNLVQRSKMHITRVTIRLDIQLNKLFILVAYKNQKHICTLGRDQQGWLLCTLQHQLEQLTWELTIPFSGWLTHTDGKLGLTATREFSGAYDQ